MLVVLRRHCSPSKATEMELRVAPVSFRTARANWGSVDAPCETIPSARSELPSVPKEYNVLLLELPEPALNTVDVEYQPPRLVSFVHAKPVPVLGRLSKFWE